MELIETDLATAAHRGRVRLRAAGRKVLYGRLKGARVLVENGVDLHAKCKKGMDNADLRDCNRLVRHSPFSDGEWCKGLTEPADGSDPLTPSFVRGWAWIHRVFGGHYYLQLRLVLVVPALSHLTTEF